MKQGWDLKKIGEIGTVFNGNSINAKVKKEKYTNLEEGLPYIATKDISYESVIDYGNGIKIPDEDKSSFKIASQNTILICAEGGSAGRKIGFTDQEVCFGNKLFALSTTDKVNSRFVYYYYFSPQFQEDFASQLTGIIGGVSMAKFKKLKVPLPSPPEQQRIVQILEKAFVAIDKAKQNAEQNLSNTRELFKSYLNEIFENSNNTWQERPLNELCVKERIITYGVIKLGDNTINGVPCLRTSNVRWLNIDISGIKLIEQQLSSEYSRTILKGAEVLVNVRGTLGGVAVVSDNMVGWNVSREVAVVPIDKDIVDPFFISFFIGSDLSQMWFNSVKKGAAYVGINIEDLRRLPIYFPKIDAQRIIVERIKDVQRKYYNALNIYERKIANLQELKKSILQKAFEGEL